MDRVTSNIIPVWPWFNPPAPAPALDVSPALRPGPRASVWFGHEFAFRQQPNPGAPAFAYLAKGLYEFSPIGAGTINRETLSHDQPGTAFAALGLRTHGLGGLVQGQMVTAPLVVPGELQMDVGGDETAFSTG